MRKTIYLLTIFSIWSFSLESQSIKEIEEDLWTYYSGEYEYGKIAKARLLQKMDPFNERAIEYIVEYYEDREIDSVSIFFNNLITQFPDSVQPHLLRAKLAHLGTNKLNDEEFFYFKISHLKKAFSIDPGNLAANYYVAETYYRDFLRPHQKLAYSVWTSTREDTIRIDSLNIYNQINKLAVNPNSGDSALHYFKKLRTLSEHQRAIAFFPIQQLEVFLHQKDPEPLDSTLGLSDNCYFPIWYFANLSDDWAYDITVDYLHELVMAEFGNDWLKEQLEALNEPCLYKQRLPNDREIFRFTWLRSFDNPIAIRLERTGNEVIVYWKRGSGAGGYSPKEIVQNGSHKLTLTDWNEFKSLVANSNFETLPNEKYMMMNDGATWTLERKISHHYKAHNTNIPYSTIKPACMFLLSMTKIKVEENRTY